MCVLDADVEVAGAPGAPLDVHSLDANKDYVIVSWKQPAVDGGSPILGYFVDRSLHRHTNITQNQIKTSMLDRMKMLSISIMYNANKHHIGQKQTLNLISLKSI